MLFFFKLLKYLFYILKLNFFILDRIRHPPEHPLKHLDKDMLRPLPKESNIVQSM